MSVTGGVAQVVECLPSKWETELKIKEGKEG
jgi:hypothetical protein